MKICRFAILGGNVALLDHLHGAAINLSDQILLTMKAVVLASLLSSVAAFAPAQQRAATSSLAASAELEGMVGVDLETGKKIVSATTCHEGEQGRRARANSCEMR